MRDRLGLGVVFCIKVLYFIFHFFSQKGGGGEWGERREEGITDLCSLMRYVEFFL